VHCHLCAHTFSFNGRKTTIFLLPFAQTCILRGNELFFSSKYLLIHQPGYIHDLMDLKTEKKGRQTVRIGRLSPPSYIKIKRCLVWDDHSILHFHSMIGSDADSALCHANSSGTVAHCIAYHGGHILSTDMSVFFSQPCHQHGSADQCEARSAIAVA